jgi:hypothetical protein
MMTINDYYTISGAMTLDEANIIKLEFESSLRVDDMTKFRIIKQIDWQKEIREANLKAFNNRLLNLMGV